MTTTLLLKTLCLVCTWYYLSREKKLNILKVPFFLFLLVPPLLLVVNYRMMLKNHMWKDVKIISFMLSSIVAQAVLWYIYLCMLDQKLTIKQRYEIFCMISKLLACK